MIEAGYFPKRIARQGDRDVCSVSTCISHGPDDWVQHWRHNDLGWFNTRVDAQAVVPAGREGEFRIFAYRLADVFYRQGQRVPVEVPSDVQPEPIPPNFVSLGFDAVGKTPSMGMLGFECSPLSCNGMSEEIPTNQWDLLPSIDEAHRAAERFSIEQPEPGDYYVVEVLESVSAADAKSI